MKQILFIIILISIAMSISIGCGKKSDEATDKVPLETKKAEMKDSTRLDPAEYNFDSTYSDSYGGK